LDGDEGLVSEISLAGSISLKTGIHVVIENTAKSLSMFPPSSERCPGVDFDDMSQDFEVICWKFFNYRNDNSVKDLTNLAFDANFIADFGDTFCGPRKTGKKSIVEQLMFKFMEKADKYARSIDELEDDTVKKICKVMSRGKRLSAGCKLRLDEFWSMNPEYKGTTNVPAEGGLMAFASSFGKKLWSSIGRRSN